MLQWRHKNNSHDGIREGLYQLKLRLKLSDKGCHHQAQMLMERSKPYEKNKTGIHSWLGVNLRV